MNKIIIHGRLTRDPETNRAGNADVCKFTVAENYGKDREKANFHDCEAWNKFGEFIQKYFKKGSEIVVVGEVQQREYEKDGAKRRVYSVRVENVDFCGKATDKATEVNNLDELPWN